MIALHDIVHVPALEQWLDRLSRAPGGLIVVAGLSGDGLAGVAGILFRYLLAGNADELKRRALAVGAGPRFARPSRRRRGQVTYVRTDGSKGVSYADALRPAATHRADVVVLDALSSDNLTPALQAASRGCRVLAPVDTVLVGGQVLGLLSELGAPPALLEHVSWVVSVRRAPAVCKQCGEPWEPSHAELEAMGLSPERLGGGRFRRNRGCAACESNGTGVTVFDLYRHRPNGAPGAPAPLVSDLPMRAYALELARLGHIPLPAVGNLDLGALQRLHSTLLETRRQLEQTEVELRAKVAALEASHRVLLNSTQALISLQDVTQALAAASDRDVASRIMRHTSQTMDADLVALYLVEEDGSGEIAAHTGWHLQEGAKRMPAAEVHHWLARAESANAPLLKASEVPPGLTLPGDRESIRGGILLVLSANGVPVGLLFAHSTVRRRFEISEKNVLQMFADQAAVAIQRRRLISELHRKIRDLEEAQAEIAQKERLERELELGREIQESLLPRRFPQHAGLELAARSVPARVVGGDFYDAFTLPGSRLGLVIGDVSDKGIPAALYMALTRSLLRAEAQRESSPARVLQNVNRLLLAMSDSAMFVTAFYGILDLERAEMLYARAGHERPLHFRATEGTCYELPGSGVALSVLPDLKTTEHALSLKPGDELVLFTDGVTDELLPSGEAYGHERLAAAIAAHSGLDVEAQCEAIFAELSALQEAGQQFDDAAIVLLRLAKSQGSKNGSPGQDSRLG